MYLIKKEFKVSQGDRTFLEELKPNLPETHLTKKEIQKVGELYHKYIGRTIDNLDWNQNLEDVEKSEKWPSGPRMKMHEARRICLGFVLDLREKMTDKQAAKTFHSSLRSRSASRTVTLYAYDQKY